MDLRERVLAKYLEGAVVKTADGPPPLGNDLPPGEDPGTNPVMAASGLPGGDGGGPGKRNIPKDHPYDPRALKPLSRMLWAMSVALGHGLTAYRQFAKLKSSTISPDGMLGGRGYVMQVKEIRDKLHDANENLSAISDTIHDEINAPHWEPKMDQLDPSEALDVRKFIQESQQILQNPEEDAEDEMEAIQDSSQEDPGAEGEEDALGEDGAQEGVEDEEGVETPAVDPDHEQAFLQDQEGNEEAAPGEEAAAPGEDDEETVPGDEDEESYGREDGEEEVPPAEGEEVPPGEEEGTEGLPPEEGEEEVPPVGEEEEPTEDEEESYSREDDEDESEDTADDEEEDPTIEDGEDEVPSDEEAAPMPPGAGEEPSEDEDESYSREDDEEEPSEEDEEEPEDEDEDDEEDDGSLDITPEDEALADAAWDASALPGAEEPKPEIPLQPNKKPKKKKKRNKFTPDPDAPPASMVQDQKFAPDQARLASDNSYDRTADVPATDPSSLPGPRVNQIDRGEATGPGGSYNRDEPEVDQWSLNDGRPEMDEGKYVDRLAQDNSVESWWDGLPAEERTLTATSLQLRTADRLKWSSEDWEKVFACQFDSSSGMPEDLDTPTDGWDLGLGYGAKGDGAGGYANPSGEGDGDKGVFGPTSGLPKDSTGLMPTDVEPPVARSDYYTDGLTDDDIFAQAMLPGEPAPTQPPSNYYFGQSELPDTPNDEYSYDRDVMNTDETVENMNTPYAEKPRSPARSDSTPS